jgi:NAD(P)-dependent dehydrogenase (short-subunit alcohol dehydrogenase family)
MEGRLFAILGGASGIGLSMALLMASLGTDVSITDVRRQEELDKTLTSIR